MQKQRHFLLGKTPQQTCRYRGFLSMLAPFRHSRLDLFTWQRGIRIERAGASNSDSFILKMQLMVMFSKRTRYQKACIGIVFIFNIIFNATEVMSLTAFRKHIFCNWYFEDVKILAATLFFFI